jgi:gluconolactonase
LPQTGAQPVFCDVRLGASDAFRIDINGNLLTSSHDSVQVYAPDGCRLGKILVPEIIADCTFGGPSASGSS